jgi:hypothetical protein
MQSRLGPIVCGMLAAVLTKQGTSPVKSVLTLCWSHEYHFCTVRGSFSILHDRKNP